ncbi:MAG: hypothetical protein M1822_001021 [Bathelium mastoideum]|nr:MAG: hypothetical protein M1822_001021 [Bathelium mastoideum]
MVACLRSTYNLQRLHIVSSTVKAGTARTLSTSTAIRFYCRVPHRLFSHSLRRYGAEHDQDTSFHRVRKTEQRAAAYEGVIPETCIPPAPDNPDAWLSVIEPILPRSLRESEQDFIKETTFTEYLPQILVRARRAYNVDILSHLGLEKGRWRAVVWLVKNVVDQTSLTEPIPEEGLSSSDIRWCRQDQNHETDPLVKPPEDSTQLNQPWPSRAALREISNSPIWLEFTGRQRHMMTGSLDKETGRYDEADIGPHMLRKTALGQVWRSLGSMVLVAADEPDAGKSSIMPHVLQMIAHLHHMGLIADAVYEYASTLDDYVLKQPPILHLFSSRILAALSDAVWQAHELQVKEEERASGAQYTFLGYEIPGSRFRVRQATISPELWLEFILWSCLHGGWLEDGFAILEAVYRKRKEERPWTLFSWQNLLAQHKFTDDPPIQYSTFGMLMGTPIPKISKHEPEEGDVSVKRTISNEVVVAYIDAFLSVFRVGVGKRGLPAGSIIHNVTVLKAWLDSNDMSLPSASWDALIVRIVESQGIDVDRDPVILDRILASIGTEYGEHYNAKNTQAINFELPDSPTYVFDGAAVVLGLYHRVLRAFILRGDVEGAFTIFVRLQDYTDRNKERSIRKFVKIRNKKPSSFFDQWVSVSNDSASDSSAVLSSMISDFDQNNIGIDYPAFFIRMPNPLAASLLNLITASETFDFGRYLIYSQDIDGPTIQPSAYSDPILASSLIRFATASQDHQLFLKVMSALRASQSMTEDQERSESASDSLPKPIVHSFLENQIRKRKWDAVESLLDFVRDTEGLNWNHYQAAWLAREILSHRANLSAVMDFSDYSRIRIKPDEDLKYEDEDTHSLAHVLRIFYHLIFGRWNKDKYRGPRVRMPGLRTLIGLLADLGPEWKALAPDLLKFVRNEMLYLPLSVFDPILEGVVNRWGPTAGIRLIEKWCGKSEVRNLLPLSDIRRDPNVQVERQQIDGHDSEKLVAEEPKTPLDEHLEYGKIINPPDEIGGHAKQKQDRDADAEKLVAWEPKSPLNEINGNAERKQEQDAGSEKIVAWEPNSPPNQHLEYGKIINAPNEIGRNVEQKQEQDANSEQLVAWEPSIPSNEHLEYGKITLPPIEIDGDVGWQEKRDADSTTAAERRRDDDLIRGAGVRSMARKRPSRSEELTKESVRVSVDRGYVREINFTGRGESPNVITLDILIRGALRAWREMERRQRETGVTEADTATELGAAFEWIKRSYSELGLVEERIEAKMRDA